MMAPDLFIQSAWTYVFGKIDKLSLSQSVLHVVQNLTFAATDTTWECVDTIK